MFRPIDVATSVVATLLRGRRGGRVEGAGARPKNLLQLYDFEGCPFCRRVRETLSTLDLDVLVYPCPKGGGFRDAAFAKGGKLMFPLLVDTNSPNGETVLYESKDIVRYLLNTYGDGRSGSDAGPVGSVSGALASAVRARGVRARPALQADKLLKLWSYEGSPFSRIVRERLCELGLAYTLVNVAKGSAKRADFVAHAGKMMVPYLEDPNTNTAMFESADIAAYLERTYAKVG